MISPALRVAVRRVGGAAGLGLWLLAFAVPPVDAQAVGQVPVATRDLPRGATLTQADIRYDAPIGSVRGSTDAVEPGWVTRRVITRGEVLSTPGVAPPQMVRPGDPVDMIWREGAVQLRIRGTAMGSAAAGEKVTVRIDTRRRFEGVAVGPGLVLINGGSGEE